MHAPQSVFVDNILVWRAVRLDELEMFIPYKVLPCPALPCNILYQSILTLSIDSKIHNRRSIDSRCFPTFDWNLPWILCKVRPCMPHRIAKSLLLSSSIGLIVCREDDRDFCLVIHPLYRYRPSVIRQISEELVGKSRIE